VWWYSTQRLRQEDPEFEDNLSYIVSETVSQKRKQKLFSRSIWYTDVSPTSCSWLLYGKGIKFGITTIHSLYN
jgi:hypothetical protein